MAIVHQTTLVPTKLELLTDWLPGQPWYRGSGAPELTRVGGFRLDDPEGEVGIEFMVAVDTSGPEPVTYHLPLTYRGAAYASAEKGLIGTAEHGVLGRRYIYDGTHDPVLVSQLIALMQGEAQAQAQRISDTPDPTVGRAPVPGGAVAFAGSEVVDNDRDGTRVRATATGAGGGAASVLLRVRRVLDDGTVPDGTVVDGTVPDGDDAHGADAYGRVVVTWQRPGGAEAAAVTVSAVRAGE
jgi:hypothetical protein